MESLTEFLYPPNGNQTTDTLSFNFLDSVNVSWTTNAGDSNLEPRLIFWVQPQKGRIYAYFDKNFTTLNASFMTNLSVGGPYPVLGHFNLRWNFNNGTPVGGPNSQRFGIASVQTDQTTTWSAPASTPLVVGSLASTASQVTSATQTIQTLVLGSSAPQTPAATTQPLSQASSTSISGGAIGGIVVGAMAVIVMAFGALWIYNRKQRARERVDQLTSSNFSSKLKSKVFSGEKTQPMRRAELDTINHFEELPGIPVAREMDGMSNHFGSSFTLRQ